MLLHSTIHFEAQIVQSLLAVILVSTICNTLGGSLTEVGQPCVVPLLSMRTSLTLVTTAGYTPHTLLQ